MISLVRKTDFMAVRAEGDQAATGKYPLVFRDAAANAAKGGVSCCSVRSIWSMDESLEDSR